MDLGVRRGVCKAEGIPSQPASVVQARVRYPTPPILRREGDQFGTIAGARPDAEVDLLCQQGIAGAIGEIPGLRESNPGSSILSEKTSPLLP